MKMKNNNYNPIDEYKEINLSKCEKKDLRKNEKKNIIKDFYFVFLFLLIIFGWTLLEGLLTGKITFMYYNAIAIISYEENPKYFIFAILFSLIIVIYSSYKLFKKFHSLKRIFNLQWRYLFYIIAFILISFPLWVFIIGIIF